MIGGNKPHGYTIVEVLIFLAISSLMFLLAAGFISGKQSAVEFKQGMNDINTQIGSVVNDVANGQYPPSATFTCTAPPLSPPVFTAATTAQGSNGGCIFLGKVMQFNVAGDPTVYNIYTVAARQMDPTGASITSFTAAKPIAVDDGGAINLTQKNTLQSGLVVTKVLKCTGNCSGGTPIGSFGFFGSLGNYGLSQSSTPESGAQTVVTAIVPNTPANGTFGASETSAVTNINAKAGSIGPTDIVGNGTYILMCFQNGNKKGSVSIGGQSGQQFTTTLETGAGVPSIC